MSLLYITNNFPHASGQLHPKVAEVLGVGDAVVFASTTDEEQACAFDARQDYPVIRWPRPLIVPSAAVRSFIVDIVREYDIETVWCEHPVVAIAIAKKLRLLGVKKIRVSLHPDTSSWAVKLARRCCDELVYIAETQIEIVPL